jgi:hypothetical protein
MIQPLACCLLLGLLVFTSCNPSPSSIDEPEGLATPDEITSAATRIRPTFASTGPSLAPLHCAENDSELPIIPDGEYQAWCQYVHSEFSLAVPPDWGVRTSGEHLIYVFPQDSPDTTLTLGFRRVTEHIAIQRTDVGAGEISTGGTVGFLGEQVSREVLVYEGNVKAVRYNNTAETQRDQMVFTLSLDDWRTDYRAVSLSPEIQATADRIVESIQLKP